jgi:hypothetical protein
MGQRLEPPKLPRNSPIVAQEFVAAHNAGAKVRERHRPLRAVIVRAIKRFKAGQRCTHLVSLWRW